MTPRMLLSVLTLVIVVALAGACGGGEEATPTAQPQPTATRPAPTATTAAPQPTATPRPQPTQAPQPTATPRPQPTQAPTPGPATTGKLTIVVPSFEREQVQPSRTTTGMLSGYLGPLYDWWVWSDTDGNLKPGIMTKWEQAPDALSWTLTLQQGMRFHNGATITADDVKFSLERLIADAPNPLHTTFSATPAGLVASIAAASPTEVRLNLKKPWPLMPLDMSVRAGTEGIVAPKVYFESVGPDGFDARPVGSGPWKFARHDSGIRFVFEATGTPHPYRPAPPFKDLEFLIAPEESTRVAMLKTGAAQLVSLGSADSAAALRQAEFPILVISGGTIGNILLYGAFDTRVKDMPIAKKEVREALGLAINVREMVDTIFHGLAEPARDPSVGPGGLGFDPSWKSQLYDPTRAKALLAQAGYPTGFPIRIYSHNAAAAPWSRQQADATAGYWNAVGVRPQVIPVEIVTLAAMYRARPQNIDLVGQASPLYVPVFPAPLGVLLAYYHPRGSTFLLSGTNPEMAALIDAAQTETDLQKQIQLIRQIAQKGRDLAVALPGVVVPSIFGAAKNIGGWQPMAGGWMSVSLETITIRR